MKTVIYYFSGTGNSLVLARGLATRLGADEPVNLRHCRGREIQDDADRVGIVFPVYAFGPPQLVVRFLNGFSTAASYVFAICNCGGSPGSALRFAAGLLQRRGIRLAAGFSIVMPSNYLPFGGAPAVERQQQLFLAAGKRLDRIGELVAAGVVMAPEKTSWLPDWFSHAVYRWFVAGMKKSSRKFFVTDQCTRCGLCEKICPVGNITLTDGRPQWGERCEMCLACLQWCPAQAIAFGREYRGRRHYHHPDVAAADLM
ncbi:MAG: EFR1 family ferrodoxin [Victivallales bacterium]|nr:EFR1 family ferrodoxin [Victivallales bacterium]